MLSRLSRNVVSNLAGQVALTLLSLLAVHIVYRKLGGSAFGIVTVALVWNATLVSALELGFSTVVVRAVAVGRSGQGEDPLALLQSATTAYWTIAILGAIAVNLVLPTVFPLLFRSTSAHLAGGLTATRILLTGGLLAIPRAFYQATVRGAEQMGRLNLISVASQGMQQLGIFVLASAGVGLVYISWWIAAAFAMSTGATMLVARLLVGKGGLRPGWDASAIRRTRAQAASMAVLSATAVVQTQGDKSAVSWTLPVETAGYYATGARLLGRVQALVTAAIEASLPAITRSAHLEDHKSLVARYHKLNDLVCFASLPLYATVAYSVGPVFSGLFSSGAARSLQLPVALLALGFFMNSSVSALYISALGMGEARVVARVNVFTTCLVFPIVVVLTHVVGLVGASLSWLLYGVVTFVIMIPRLSVACLGTSPWAWFKRSARILPSTVTFVGGWVILDLLGPDRVVVVVACLAATLLLHLVLSLFLVGPELRSTALSALSSRTSRGAQ